GSAEPYIYQNEVKDWAKPVAYAYINDAGWENYAESIATKPENITKYADCFKALVPMIQQSSVDYLNSPAAANKIILDAVKTFDNGWVYSQGVADYGVKTIKSDGLVANGPDKTLGNFDLDRVNALIAKAIPVYTALGQAPKAGLKAEDIVTNQFIDPSIGL
ncbi:MAG: ABC transporter substrate-binding protein, partial [Ilumatobacteraceae bacterium]